MKYLAEFPMKYGDMARRVYTSRAEAIKQTKKHLRACESPEREYGEVWEYPGDGAKTLVYESDTEKVWNE